MAVVRYAPINIAGADLTVHPIHYICDTTLELPTSGLKLGDTALTIDTNAQYMATSATTWAAIGTVGGSTFLTFSNLGASTTPDVNSNTSGTSFVTPSWTPPSAGLIVLDVCSEQASGFPSAPTVTGNSITWVQIATITFASTRRLTRYGANAAGSAAGATTIGTFGGSNQLSCRASFYAVDGTDVANGVAQTFVQSPTGNGTGTSGSITLAAGSNSRNRPIAAFHHLGDNEAKTARASWTALDDLHNFSSMSLATQYRSDAFETTASATWTTSAIWAGISSELKATGATLPITLTSRATINSATDATSYASGSFTPTANTLLVAIYDSDRTSADPTTPTVAGHGTWTAVDNLLWNSDITDHGKLFIFALNTGASPAASTVTFDHGATTHHGAEASIFELSGTDVANGVAQCFRQLVHSSVNTDGGASQLAVTLASPGTTRNRSFMALGHLAATALLPQTNWVAIHDLVHATPSQGLYTEWRSDAFDTAAFVDYTSLVRRGGISFEIKAL
jgi:hypothetical protein